MIINIRLENIIKPKREVKFNQELCKSIEKNGLMQPIVVRKIKNKYEIIDGVARFEVYQQLNKEFIPAYIVNMTDKELKEYLLLKPISHVKTNPKEWGKVAKKLIDSG